MIRCGQHILLALVLAGLTVGCDTADPAPITIVVPREVPNSDYTTTESGLKYFDFETGEGAEAEDSSRVRLHYVAWLQNGRLLASTYSTEDPVEVDLSSDSIIQGWIEGVPGMRPGGERQLVVPPDLAYGADGFPQAGIPPNSTLIYEIELMSVESD